MPRTNIQVAHLVNYNCHTQEDGNHSKEIGLPPLTQLNHRQIKHDTKYTWHIPSDNNVVILRTCIGKTKYAFIENVNTIDKRRSKIERNRVFDCHFSPDWRQMAIANTFSSDFGSHSAIVTCKSVLDWRLSGV